MLNRDGLFKGLSFDKIYEVFSDVFNFMAEGKTELTAISIIINKNRLYKGKDADEWAYRLLVERINNYLAQENQQRVNSGLTAEFGIMIIDSCGVQADQKTSTKNHRYAQKRNILFKSPIPD